MLLVAVPIGALADSLGAYRSLPRQAGLCFRTAPDVGAAMRRWWERESHPSPGIEHAWAVPPVEVGQRLSCVAGRAFRELGSKSQAAAAAKRGELLLNGARAEQRRLLRAGDLLTLALRVAPPPPPSSFDARIRFVSHLRSQAALPPCPSRPGGRAPQR